MPENMLTALSDNIVIDKDKCIFCGKCIDTCILDNLRMKIAPCTKACPLGVNCQGYVQLIGRGFEEEALEEVEKSLPFPTILGRLCSAPCEAACHRRAVTGEAVSIRALKRYLTDRLQDRQPVTPEIKAATGKRCLVIGAGPAGMMAAYVLRLEGHDVTMIDAAAEPGGMLRWGVPEFRFPKSYLDREIHRLEQMGIDIQCNMAVGLEVQFSDLVKQYDAVIVATGCPEPKYLGMDNENAMGITHALPFLIQMRAGRPPEVGRKVVVVGGGEVAFDVAQTALRLGAESVSVYCLETRNELLADPHIVRIAENEGVVLNTGFGPTRILVRDGHFCGLELHNCTRVYDENDNFSPRFGDIITTCEADTLIVAIGQTRTPGGLIKKGLQYNELTYRLEGYDTVFVAGDFASGPATIVEGMRSGREAAISVIRLLQGQHLSYERAYEGPVVTEYAISTDRGSALERTAIPVRHSKGPGDFHEVEQTFSEEQAAAEASRCYSCGSPVGRFRTCWFCLPCEVECPTDALYVQIPYLLR
ncbi:NADPH-dependent glutamate synthase beta chain [Desulfofustis glycolicus DSM 9705]|uniref:NADPH-dependent glutamate synthase beta chain n=2 Tax=Desulfofustis glycolicus TaxID=51195 RepID=A0A1M5YH37_9BACT|nr:NADPH-dependent glutamate synthase beta chain [Desulfofustis glycolicus DSM 9705]